MSESGLRNLGRPDANVEASYLAFRYCGGSGGGGCITTLGQTGIVLSYRLQKFIVHNKRIIFENKEFFGVRIYSDAGASGGCSHSLGVEQPFWMALSIDGNLTDAQVVERGVQLSGPLPYTIEFKAEDIPQPYEGGWSAHIFVHLYWGNAGFIVENQDSEITEASMRVVKHDYDINI